MTILSTKDWLEDSYRTVIGGDVADGGTFTVAYRTGRSAKDYAGPGAHRLFASGAVYTVADGMFTVSFGASVITVTWQGGRVLKSGTEVVLGFVRPYSTIASEVDDAPAGVYPLSAHLIDFGAPTAPNTNAIIGATLMAEAGFFPLAAPVVADTPRGIRLAADTTNHSARTVTIRGKDAYGNPITESRSGPSGNTVLMKKAFAVVESIHVDGAVATNGISVGWGSNLGLPFFVANKGLFLKASVDGVDELAGATVVGGHVAGASTATTDDVRGTIVFDTSADGSKHLTAIVLGGTKLPVAAQYAE